MTERAARKRAALPFTEEQELVSNLRPHPRNYREHPEDQLTHISESIRQHGFYRNVVVARDGTILAGHGVVLAAQRLKIERVPVRRLDLDPEDPRALKVLTGDNELTRFAFSDDRALSELLREISQDDSIGGLLGTGYDDQMLAALVMNTRSAHEIRDIDEAAEWVGMPEYDAGAPPIKLIITFKSKEERKRFCDEHQLKVDMAGEALSWGTRWPWTERVDESSVRFEGE